MAGAPEHVIATRWVTAALYTQAKVLLACRESTWAGPCWISRTGQTRGGGCVNHLIEAGKIAVPLLTNPALAAV